MRLLHIDSGKLISTDFRGKTFPPYAILSHRWGDSEVLFEDLDTSTYEEKKGFRKIEFCAAQAARDQLKYFWIDTCCIDKWNLREHSNAINSMFTWYKNAAKCYVFLPDVSAAVDASQSDWEASFRASEWFTRGWTLQELIAPTSVEFFSCEGRRIGDKKSLESIVHETTGIPLKVLRNGPLDEFTTDERRNWAKNRETSEEEDSVYCLLGILDVFIPTVYGEGAEKAWQRLQMELERAGSAPSMIPYLQNEYFVGRESQLAELEAKLFKDDQASTMAIVGPPGTGKSQLALEVAHRTRQHYRNCYVFWIDASDKDRLDRSYAGIAQKLNITGWNNEMADSKQLVKAHLSGEGKMKYLLVLDNADDMNLRSGEILIGTALLSDYMPQSKLCAILYTTTKHDMAEMLAAPNIVELKDMTPSMAQMMLENHLNAPLSTNEQQEAQHLLHELFCLPLAITQAAAYMNTHKNTLREYRLLVARQKEVVFARDTELPKDGHQEYTTTGPITRTLLISLDHIRGKYELAANYLFLAACVDRKDIPLDLLPTSSPRERNEAVKILDNYKLITRRPADSSLDLHQLIHHALRDWLRNQERLDEWMEHAIEWLYMVFPGDNHGTRSKLRRLFPHARYALAHSPPAKRTWAKLGLEQKFGLALHNDGRWKESEQLWLQVLETSKKAVGDEHADTLTSMNNLAGTYTMQCQWEKASQLLMQVMETRKRILGDDHPDTLTSMSNLAFTYENQGQWKEAEELLVKVIEARKRVIGDEHPHTLTSMSNMALLYHRQSRWKEAEELDMQLIEIRSRVLGDKHPDTLTSMNNLALTYESQGKWKEAEELGRQVIETKRRVLGDEHPDTLISMNNLAYALRGQGLHIEAVLLLEQCWRLREKVLGSEHPYTVASFENLQAWKMENISEEAA